MAMNQQYKSLATIEPHDAADPIEVKILRKWITDGYRADLCYLLIDREGAVIQALVNPGDETYIDSRVSINSCYRVVDYLSITARSYINMLQHPAMVKLSRGSTITHIPNIGFPDNYCISGTLTDHTTEATVILFDVAMESFVQTTCAEMIHRYTEIDIIPDPIQDLKGQSRTFEIQFNKKSYTQSTQLVINRVLQPSLPKTNEASQPTSPLAITEHGPQTPAPSNTATVPKATPPSAQRSLHFHIQDADSESAKKRLKEAST